MTDRITSLDNDIAAIIERPIDYAVMNDIASRERNRSTSNLKVVKQSLVFILCRKAGIKQIAHRFISRIIKLSAKTRKPSEISK